MSDPRLASLAKFRLAVADGTLYELPAKDTDRAILAIITMAEAAIATTLTQEGSIATLRSTIALLEALVTRQGSTIDALRTEAERLHQSVSRWAQAQGITSRAQ